MTTLADTFSDFFGPQIEENEHAAQGNQIRDELEKLGFSFDEHRQILSGEKNVDLPDALTLELWKWQAAEAKQKADEIKIERTPITPKPAYGDFEATGWMDENHFGDK